MRRESSAHLMAFPMRQSWDSRTKGTITMHLRGRKTHVVHLVMKAYRKDPMHNDLVRQKSSVLGQPAPLGVLLTTGYLIFAGTPFSGIESSRSMHST